MQSAPAEPGSAAVRIPWIDSARGLSVVAIVLFHVVLWDYLPTPGASNSPLKGVWAFQNGLLGSVRIPMLLVLSGMLASKRIRRGFADPGLSVNIVTNVYFYWMWLCIYGVFFLATVGSLPHRIERPIDFFQNLLLPDTTLWYIFALVVFVLLLALCRRMPPWVVLAVLVVLCVVVRSGNSVPAMWPRIPESAIYFALGVYASDWLTRMAPRLRWWHLAPLLMLPPIFLVAHGRVDVELIQDVLELFVQLSFAALAIAVVIKACQFKLMRAFGESVGRKTLAIYVLHALLLYGWMLFGQTHFGSEMRSVVFGSSIGSSLYPLVMTLIVVLLALGGHKVATVVGLRFLFVAPPMLRSLVHRAYQRIGRGRTTSA